MSATPSSTHTHIDIRHADSNRHAMLKLKGDTESIAAFLRYGYATMLIEQIASEQVTAEGDISSLAWLCYAINSEASAPRNDYALTTG